MKRMLALLLLVCMVFSGCGVKKEPVDLAERNASSSETEKSNSTETVNAAALPKETTQEERKRTLLRKLYEEDGDCKGAYLLPVALEEEESVICMECYQEELLILSADTKLNIRLFNLDTGRMDAHRTIDIDGEGRGDGGYLSDGSIWVYSPGEGKVYYMDQNLENQGEEVLSGHDNWYSDRQEDILWFRDYDSNTLSSYQIASGEVRKYDLNALMGTDLGMAGIDWNVEGAAYGAVYFGILEEGGVQKRYYFVPSARSVESNELMSNIYMHFYKDGSVYQFQDQYRIVDYAVPDRLMSVKAAGAGEYIMDYQQNYLISGAKGQVLIYSCSNGSCYGVYKIESDGESEEELSNYISVAAVRPEEQQIILSLETPGQKKLVLCDLDLAEITGHFERSSNTGEQISQQLEQGWHELEQRYDMEILTAEEAENRQDWSGYHLEENSWLLNSLDAYEAFCGFLDKLPDGMFSEILSGNSGKIEFYFSGPITGEEGSGNLASAGGYVTEIYDEITSASHSRLVVDISDPEALQRYLAHEFLHLMENRFVNCEYEISMVREGMYERTGDVTPEEMAKEEIIYDWVSQWIDMSPEDAYIYDSDETLCYSEHGVDYVYIDEEDRDRVYFVDSYGRTYPKEDRARIFEYLYMDAIEEGVVGWLECEHLRDKSVYLCQLIRCCYPSADISTRNVWEQALNDEDWGRIKENREQRLGGSAK